MPFAKVYSEQVSLDLSGFSQKEIPTIKLGLERIMHANATHLGYKFNVKNQKDDSKEYFHEANTLSTRDEFFKGFQFFNDSYYSTMPIFQCIIYHICKVLAEDVKIDFAKSYLLFTTENKKKRSDERFNSLYSHLFWKPAGDKNLWEINYPVDRDGGTVSLLANTSTVQLPALMYADTGIKQLSADDFALTNTATAHTSAGAVHSSTASESPPSSVPHQWYFFQLLSIYTNLNVAFVVGLMNFIMREL